LLACGAIGTVFRGRFSSAFDAVATFIRRLLPEA
jgi:hypothetical protein